MNEKFTNITLEPKVYFEDDITGGSFALNWETENNNGSVIYKFDLENTSFEYIGGKVDPSVLLIEFYDNFTVRSDIDEKFEIVNNRLKREPRNFEEKKSEKETEVRYSECKVIPPYKSHDGGFIISWEANIGFGEASFVIRDGVVFVDGELLYDSTIRKILSSLTAISNTN